VAVLVKTKHGVMIETPMEARQAEPGPSILLLLIISVSIAVIAMAFVWFLFFRTSANALRDTF
jgi:flagellar basal body-associated protein FliL